MQVEDQSTGNGNNGDTEFVDPSAAVGGGTSDDGGTTGTIRDSAGTEFDGRIHSGPGIRNRDGTFTRRRGRRSGPSQNKTKVHSDLKASTEMLTKALLISHVTIAAMTKTPEIALDERE